MSAFIFIALTIYENYDEGSNEIGARAKVSGYQLRDFRFADDQGMMSSTEAAGNNG